MQKQYKNKQKNITSSLSPDMLYDIFRAANRSKYYKGYEKTPTLNLNLCAIENFFKKYAIKLMSSSKMIYVLAGKFFKNLHSEINKQKIKFVEGAFRYSLSFYQGINSTDLRGYNSISTKRKMSSNTQSSSQSLNTPVCSPATYMAVKRDFQEDAKKSEAKKKCIYPSIGIDLGTTYSSVGVYRNGNFEIIPYEQCNKMPCVVAFTDTERLIGAPAKDQIALNPKNTIVDVKRIIGRKWDDPSFQQIMRHLPFTLLNREGKPIIEVEFKGEKKTFHPEQISAMFIAKMKQNAEAYLGHPVRDAVISVPANFNDGQRQATKDACHIGGLNVLQIINEPSAAALSYGLGKQGNKHILIIDFGGGFLVTVLAIARGLSFQVKSTVGDTHLGGEDFDDLLVDHFEQEFMRKQELNIKNCAGALRLFRTSAERAKRSLSSFTEATFKVDSNIECIDFHTTIIRARFEYLCEPLFRKTLELVEKSLRDADLDKSKIDEIVLVGGSTRIPKIQEMLKKFFGRELDNSINPDEAVVYGAAVQAAILSENDTSLRNVRLVDVTPLSLGIGTIDSVFNKLIERNAAIPHRTSQMLSTFMDNQTCFFIKIFEGEEALTKENNLLGRFGFYDITPAPQRVTQIDVTFDLDVNGIFQISALDRATRSQIPIKNEKGRLNQSEILRMIDEAKSLDDEDLKQRKRIVSRNKFEEYLYEIKSTLKGKGVKILGRAEEVIQQNLNWLYSNMAAKKEDYDSKQKETQVALSKIVAVFHQSKGDDEEGGEQGSSSN